MRICYLPGIGIAGILATVLLAPIPAASAAELQQAPVESKLVVADIDEEQARSVGNRVEIEGGFKALIDGQSGELIARVPTPGTAQPRGTVYGDCGLSYLHLFDGPGDDYFFTTGFDLYSPRVAIDFHFEVLIRGQWEGEENSGGTDDFTWDSFGQVLDSPETWHSGEIHGSQDAPSGTHYTAEVTTGFAVLASGEICYSGLPSDGRMLNR